MSILKRLANFFTPKTPEQQGKAAVPNGSNPYQPGTPAHADWQKGFDDQIQLLSEMQTW